MAERWRNVRVGQGVRYVTESGLDLAATVSKVHKPEMVDQEDADGEPTGKKVLAPDAQEGLIDLNVADPGNPLDAPHEAEGVPHSLKGEANTWHYA